MREREREREREPLKLPSALRTFNCFLLLESLMVSEEKCKFEEYYATFDLKSQFGCLVGLLGCLVGSVGQLPRV